MNADVINDEWLRKIIHDFKVAIIEIDSLNDFFEIHSKTILKEIDEISNQYRIGLKISDLLDSFYLKKNEEEKTQYINSIKEELIFDNKRLKDIIDIAYDHSTGSIAYCMMPQYSSKMYNPRKAKDKNLMKKNQEKIFAQSILSNAIIIYESYFAKIYEVLAIAFPELYLENKQIPLSRVLTDDLNELISKSITIEVEQNMYDTLKTLDKLKEKNGFDIDRFFKIRKKFEEIYYRRNVFVHNNGLANDIYLAKVDANYRKEVDKNQYLICDGIYLSNAIQTIKKVICTMHFELLKVCEANESDYVYLSNVGFESLCAKEYGTAEHIYGILSRNRDFQYINRATFQINYINALKQQNKNYQNLLDSFDVSMATDTFRIAKLCLENDHKAVFDLLNETYPNSFKADQIREWPLFINFRETEFYDIFREKHSDDFCKFTFEDNAIHNDESNQ